MDNRMDKTGAQLAVAPANVQQRVEDMNAGWRNCVSQILGMDPNTFQLTQGTLGLQTSDSSGLFRIANGVPPETSVAFFDASSNTMRSDSYGIYLNALLAPSSSGMIQALGPMYAQWVIFKKGNFTKYTSLDTMFDAFAMGNLNTVQTKAGKTVLAAAKNAPMAKAIDNYLDPQFQTTFVDSTTREYTLPTYSGDIAAATAAINNGKSATISFDTKTMTTTSKSTVVTGGASGMYDIFFGGGSGSYSKYDGTAASSEFTITGKIGSYGTVPTVAAGWYNGSEVTRGYNGKNDFTIWDANSNSGDWNNFFNKANGILARRVSQLLLVTDVDLTITSHATYSKADVTNIKTEASFGIWPFFSASVTTEHTNTFHHNEDGTLSVQYVLPKGKVEIWGVTVEPAPN